MWICLFYKHENLAPEVVVIANESLYPKLKDALEDLPIKVYAGHDAIAQIVE